jgi:septal ring factor EnvC (AmiA/AmiB activator)
MKDEQEQKLKAEIDEISKKIDSIIHRVAQLDPTRKEMEDKGD